MSWRTCGEGRCRRLPSERIYFHVLTYARLVLALDYPAPTILRRTAKSEEHESFRQAIRTGESIRFTGRGMGWCIEERCRRKVVLSGTTTFALCLLRWLTWLLSLHVVADT